MKLQQLIDYATEYDLDPSQVTLVVRSHSLGETIEPEAVGMLNGGRTMLLIEHGPAVVGG